MEVIFIALMVMNLWSLFETFRIDPGYITEEMSLKFLNESGIGIDDNSHFTKKEVA